ncbi:MAG: hypothetical protein B6241_12995 [Spirochaetaceae bacterium 4572_59]|nr:MAG: hypothetical protein B6241_12995 [Spirochaetaceae bacterium 4572_59]
MISKAEQLKNLQRSQILVAMWGWSPEEMAPMAVRFGYDVVNQPQGNDLEAHKRDISVWETYGLKMLVRPWLDIPDPFDEVQVKKGLDLLKEVILFHEENNPGAIGYVIQWGLFGEGGFPWDYSFSDKAVQAFNKYMGTEGQELPAPPEKGVPGSMGWINWLKFRAETLRDFREMFVSHAMKSTDRLVGTWSEVYPSDNYVLNMGEAPGADFLFYDLSFGDVTCNQRIAFGESHGEMETFPDFESWKRHELPLMAKAAGEGVIPMSFQFPMRCGDEVDNIVGKKQYCTENIEDEYSLKIGPYIRELIDAVDGEVEEPEVGLVYHSFQAAALPAGDSPSTLRNIMDGNRTVDGLYTFSSKQIETSLHQMGIHMEVIPYEWLEERDLTKYKLLIIPDPLFLNEKMRKNLKHCQRVLYSGEYMLAHRDDSKTKGNYQNGFSALTTAGEGDIEFFRHQGGRLDIHSHPLTKDLETLNHFSYPADQMFRYRTQPDGSEVLINLNGIPIIFTNGNGVFITSRAFHNSWVSSSGDLENFMFTFLKNLLLDQAVQVPVQSPPQIRGNLDSAYGSYGVSGVIGWNKTGEEVKLTMKWGSRIKLPPYGWIKVK